MKNRRILTIVALAAVSLLLASCTISVQPAPAPVRDYTFESNWRVTGTTNEWVACDNRETIFEYSFHAENPALITGITEHYLGIVSDQKKTSEVSSGWLVNGHRVTMRAQFSAGGNYLPLATGPELENQAIVVTPVPRADERGTTRFWVVVEYGSLGVEYALPATNVDIYANCP